MLDGQLLPHGRQVDFTAAGPGALEARLRVPFNQRMIRGKVLITNDFGDWLLLTPDEFRAFVEGRPQPGEPLYEKLRRRTSSPASSTCRCRPERWRRKKQYLFHGPTLHGLVLTHRCNHGCQYCHSSVVGMERMDTDMSFEVAEGAVDMALQSTAWAITIEFQGGEPTANWDVLKHVVEYATRKNREVGKVPLVRAGHEPVADGRRAARVPPRPQGPDLHEPRRARRPPQQDPHLQDGNSHELLVEWMKKINERYREMGLDTNHYRVEALPTITRPSLTRWKDIVDEFVAVGCRAIFLRKLDPFGFAAESAKTLGYSMDEYLEFYANAVDYIIELNRQGVQVMERHAAIMLNKILIDEEPELPRPPHARRRVRRPARLRPGRRRLLVGRGTLRRGDGRRHVPDRHRARQLPAADDERRDARARHGGLERRAARLRDLRLQAVVRAAGRVQLQGAGQPARAHARLELVQEAQVDLRLPDAQARIGRRAGHGDVPPLDDESHARSLHRPMTGQHLVLCDGPGGDPRAFRSAYAHYLANCCREFMALGTDLPPRCAVHTAASPISYAARYPSTRDGLLHCFASPSVGTPLRCLRLRDELPEFRARIDDAGASLVPHLLFEMALAGLLGDTDTLAWEHGAPRLASLAVGGRDRAPRRRDRARLLRDERIGRRRRHRDRAACPWTAKACALSGKADGLPLRAPLSRGR
jgi:hypothetical protein